MEIFSQAMNKRGLLSCLGTFLSILTAIKNMHIKISKYISRKISVSSEHMRYVYAFKLEEMSQFLNVVALLVIWICDSDAQTCEEGNKT